MIGKRHHGLAPEVRDVPAEGSSLKRSIDGRRMRPQECGRQRGFLRSSAMRKYYPWQPRRNQAAVIRERHPGRLGSRNAISTMWPPTRPRPERGGVACAKGSQSIPVQATMSFRRVWPIEEISSRQLAPGVGCTMSRPSGWPISTSPKHQYIDDQDAPNTHTATV